MLDVIFNKVVSFDNYEILLEDLSVKNLVITRANVDNISTDSLSQNMKNMIKKIDSNGSNYRLIVEFNNDNIATIQFNMEGV